jgi:hypothetical protein
MEWFKREWAIILTISCLIAVAVVEAWQEAISGAPAIGKIMPPRLDGWWHYAPACLLVIAGVSWLIGRRSKSKGQDQASSSKVQGLVETSPVTSPIDVDRFFRENYHSPLQMEVEGNVRKMIDSRPQAERDDFVVRFIANGIVSYLYDTTWWTIYRSQILALQALNKTVLRQEEIKKYYNAAAAQSPSVYANYSFEQWMAYMKGQTLILEQPGNTVGITVRGRDFLKYMVHHSRSADDRKY